MYVNLGIIGNPLNHSLSPRLHSYFLSKANLNGGYVCFEIEEDEILSIFDILKKYNFTGLNVTVPYKEKVLKYLDVVTGDANEIGSVNTIKIEKSGKLLGFNTDSFGFNEMMIRNGVNPENQTVMVLGSGGSALTVLHTLKNYNYKKIILLARNLKKAEEILNKLQINNIEIFNFEFLNKRRECDIIINTISLGLKGENFLDMSKVYCNNAAIDLQYKPYTTPFLMEFKNTRIKKINGLEMLILQGYKAFQIWTDANIQVQTDKIFKFLGVD